MDKSIKPPPKPVLMMRNPKLTLEQNIANYVIALKKAGVVVRDSDGNLV